jgi:hypothetical protein
LLLSAGAGDFDWRPVDFLAEGAGDAAGDLAGVDDADFLAEGAGDAALRGGMLFNAAGSFAGSVDGLCDSGCHRGVARNCAEAFHHFSGFSRFCGLHGVVHH